MGVGQTGRIDFFGRRRGGVTISMASFLAWAFEERCSVPTRGTLARGRIVTPGADGRGLSISGVSLAGFALAWVLVAVLVRRLGERYCSRALQIRGRSRRPVPTWLGVRPVPYPFRGFGKLSVPSGAGNGLLYRYIYIISPS